jgi:membrane fusion protein, multidrug efflux system
MNIVQRRNLWIAAIALLALAAVAFVAIRELPGSRAADAKAAPLIPVTAAPVVTRTMPVKLYAIGNVEPYTTVAVRARVDGQLVGVRFKEGDEVKKGAVLFEIDARPFQASLRQAEANLLRDKALLDRAVEQEKRYKDLLDKKFISPDAYAQNVTNTATAAATVRADEAAVDSAKLQLEYCTIRAPITGYAGRIMVQEGNLVKAGDTVPLVTLNQIVPVFVTFSVPEQNVSELRTYLAKGDVSVQARLPNSTVVPTGGRISFLDNSADTTTGTIKLRAEFPNTDRALWPGQFANVAVTLYNQNDAIVAPSASVQSGPSGQYVYVVKPDMTVELRNIRVARAEGDETVVASGLAAGEQVVTVGQLRLSPGAKVSLGRAASAS